MNQTDSYKPVETQAFWRQRVFESVANGRQLHQIVWDIDYEIWDGIQKETAEVLSQIPSGSSLLDVGCGYGALFECLQRTDTDLPIPKDIKYTGLDISPDLLEIAKYRHPIQRFIRGDARSTDFDDGQFDWAVCRQMKRMITENTGLWKEIELELKRVGKNALVIDYDNDLPLEWRVL